MTEQGDANIGVLYILRIVCGYVTTEKRAQSNASRCQMNNVHQKSPNGKPKEKGSKREMRVRWFTVDKATKVVGRRAFHGFLVDQVHQVAAVAMRRVELGGLRCNERDVHSAMRRQRRLQYVLFSSVWTVLRLGILEIARFTDLAVILRLIGAQGNIIVKTFNFYTMITK